MGTDGKQEKLASQEERWGQRWKKKRVRRSWCCGNPESDLQETEREKSVAGHRGNIQVRKVGIQGSLTQASLSSTQETEVRGGACIQGQHGLHSDTWSQKINKQMDK